MLSKMATMKDPSKPAKKTKMTKSAPMKRGRVGKPSSAKTPGAMTSSPQQKGKVAPGATKSRKSKQKPGIMDDARMLSKKAGGFMKGLETDASNAGKLVGGAVSKAGKGIMDKVGSETDKTVRAGKGMIRASKDMLGPLAGGK